MTELFDFNDLSPAIDSEKELASASDALFNDVTSGMRNTFKNTLAAAERVHDTSAAFLGMFFGNEAIEKHTQNLETEAINAIKSGRIDAAKHFLKRDLAFSSWTQGYDDPDTQRLLKELEIIQRAKIEKSGAEDLKSRS